MNVAMSMTVSDQALGGGGVYGRLCVCMKDKKNTNGKAGERELER
jgi:hypothetical protein